MSSATVESVSVLRADYVSGSFFRVSLVLDDRRAFTLERSDLSAVGSVVHPLVQIERTYDLRPYIATLKYLARRPELIAPALGTLHALNELANDVESMTAEYEAEDEENTERLVLRFLVSTDPAGAVALLDRLEVEYLIGLDPAILTQLAVSVLPA